MTASVSYRQVKPVDGVGLSVGAPSHFIQCMERAFGVFPVRLTKSDIPVIRGMMAILREDQDNPYGEIIGAIEKLGEIEIYAAY